MAFCNAIQASVDLRMWVGGLGVIVAAAYRELSDRYAPGKLKSLVYRSSPQGGTSNLPITYRPSKGCTYTS